MYVFSPTDSQPSTPPPPPLPRMKKKDMTLTELKKYDGSGPEGRVCVGVLGKIYDVTKGKRFYGPGKYNKNSFFRYSLKTRLKTLSVPFKAVLRIL